MTWHLALALGLALLAPISSASAQQHSDPLEAINRPIFRFNDGLDRWVLEPLAIGYDFAMPDRAQTWVDNFLTNLRFPIVLANCVLQGKLEGSASSVVRFVVNSTLGLGGFGDPATRLAIPKPDEDFGQTLGKWGLKPGAYLMLPLLGPSDLRDGVGLGVDGVTRVWPFFVDTWVTMSLTGVQTLNTRSLYLEEVRDARHRSLDYYAFVRDAYLQHRQSLVEDRIGDGGDEGPSPSDDELYFPDPDEE
ncbi:MAG: VacJ family lipoprotein [Deltaproteobacteria bacterium]|nr:VacJ family lipoprotein [Deltaproteobacteria bacterium]